MTRLATFSIIGLASLVFSAAVYAHCQVPCGVYGDQRRFETMLEDTATISKGMAQIAELSSKSDPLSHNQLARWVATKESHASNTQKIIAEYFMTQRIKPSAPGYMKKLPAAHAVMVAAMKCKQTVDPANAAALKKSILAFYEAYEGKKPHFD